MRPSLLYRLASYRAFWMTRQRVVRAAFYFNRFRFDLRQRGEQELADSRAFRSVVKLAMPQLLFALSAAIAAQATNSLFAQPYLILGWLPPEDGIYGTLLGGVTSVGAVFIGLYYAGLTAVGSAAYARLPMNVRELLIRERLGNAYMRFLAFLTFFSLCMLVLRVLGYAKVSIVVPIILVLSGVGILGFISLGQRAFYLFDPVLISDDTFVQLSRVVRQACVRGFMWHDESFQNFAKKRAVSYLDAIESLHKLCASEIHLTRAPQLSLLRRLVWFLEMYATSKPSIPTNSLWYERLQEHSSWYSSDDSAVSVAHETGTRLMPAQAVNHRWVEDRLEPLLLGVVGSYVSAGNLDEAMAALGLARRYLSGLARIGEVDTAVKLLKGFGWNVLQAISESSPSGSEQETRILAIAETIASIPIELCIEYGTNCERLARASSRLSRDEIADRRGPKIYRTQVPLKVLERLEWLADRLSFELDVDGRITSPTWYVRELILIVAADVHASNVKALTESTLDAYAVFAEQTRKSKSPWVQATILSKTWEYLHKLRHFGKSFETTWAACTAEKRVTGFPS